LGPGVISAETALAVPVDGIENFASKGEVIGKSLRRRFPDYTGEISSPTTFGPTSFSGLSIIGLISMQLASMQDDGGR